MIQFSINDDEIDKLENLDIPLLEAVKELKAADTALRDMVKVGVTQFQKFERGWQDFVQSIERAWNKIEARCGKEQKWPKLRSKYVRLRKTDELLRYVTQARNATEHTICPVVKEWDAGLRVTPHQKGVTIEGNHWDRPLLPVVNRGIEYFPPRHHLGKQLSAYRTPGVSEPELVARLAMRFYVDVLNDVNNELFPGESEQAETRSI